jgi:HEAT repeat protein
MELSEIEAALQQADYQYRLPAIAALANHPAAVAVPILQRHVRDPEFLVRTFVMRGLGKHRTEEALTALLQALKTDDTPSVRAEAANSISLFGAATAPHLVHTFAVDDHWLVRQSILAALTDLGETEALYEVCDRALSDEEFTVREMAIRALGALGQGNRHTAALDRLLGLALGDRPRERALAALSLRHFPDERARAALAQLRTDPDHRVQAAALEALL